MLFRSDVSKQLKIFYVVLSGCDCSKSKLHKTEIPLTANESTDLDRLRLIDSTATSCVGPAHWFMKTVFSR